LKSERQSKTAVSLTCVLGDIHGCLDKLRSILLRCEMHADGRPAAFVFVGDDINRGPLSSTVIDCLII
jgi:serine/threonine protein phosphatase 1